MAEVMGSDDADWIHVAGDLYPAPYPPPDFIEWALATDEADTIYGLDGDDFVFAGGGDDLVEGGEDNDVLFGEAGNDLLSGGDGTNDLFGGDGNDVLTGGIELDYLDGGDGNDTIDTGGGSAGDTAYGGGGNDILGGSGSFALRGEDGDDALHAGSFDFFIEGVMVFDGGAGIDTLVIDSGAIVIGGIQQSIFTGSSVYAIERLEFASGQDTQVYFAAEHYGEGLATGAEIAGSTHQDWVTFLLASPGIYSFSSAAFVFSGWTWGQDALIFSAAQGEEAPYAITGTKFADTIVGALGEDRLAGGQGNDVLTGDAGNDTLNGGPGLDTLIGGAGDDTLLVDSAGDVIIEAAGGGFDTLNAYASYTLAAGVAVEAMTLATTLGRSLVGNTLANALTGNVGDDFLNGGGGDDVLDGLGGADRMIGGAGNDMFRLRDTGDVLTEGVNAGTDTVLSEFDHTLAANFENLTLLGVARSGIGNAVANSLTGSTGNDALSALGGNDVLSGLAGDDTLDGGEGLDTIRGGAGRDTMTGGAGADRFVWNEGEFGGLTLASADRIVDFSQAQGDRVDLALIDANPVLAGDQAFSLIGTAGFSGAAGQIRTVASVSGFTQILADVNGDRVEDWRIRLDGTLALSAADFVL